MSKYNEYIDSCIPYVGLIPSHWKTVQNKRVMHKEKRLCDSYCGQDIVSLTINGAIVRDLNAGGKMPTTFDGYQFVYPGELLMCLFDIDVTPRCVGRVNNEGLTSPAYSSFILHDNANLGYYYYYYLMLDNTKELLHLSKNLRHSLTEEQLGQIKVPLPTLEEQIAIAEYLDKKIEHIDSIISEAKASIEEYKTWKVSIIYEAVTKGLNPNVEMKDSEIRWIGDMPAHWRLVSNKRIMHKEKRICESFAGQDVISLTMNGVIVRDLTAGGKMPTTFDGYQFVYPGELLMCLFDIDVTPRCVGRVYNKGITSPAYSSFVLNDGANLDYYYYYYLMLDNTKELVHLSKNLRHSLTEEQLGQIKVPVPPIEEQIEIGRILDIKIAQIAGLISEKESLIADLELYKKSLIFEVVTGKRKVV